MVLEIKDENLNVMRFRTLATLIATPLRIIRSAKSQRSLRSVSMESL